MSRYHFLNLPQLISMCINVPVFNIYMTPGVRDGILDTIVQSFLFFTLIFARDISQFYFMTRCKFHFFFLRIMEKNVAETINIMHSSGKHVREMYTPFNPTFI